MVGSVERRANKPPCILRLLYIRNETIWVLIQGYISNRLSFKLASELHVGNICNVHYKNHISWIFTSYLSTIGYETIYILTLRYKLISCLTSALSRILTCKKRFTYMWLVITSWTSCTSFVSILTWNSPEYSHLFYRAKCQLKSIAWWRSFGSSARKLISKCSRRGNMTGRALTLYHWEQKF